MNYHSTFLFLENTLIFAKSASNNSKDLLIVDIYKFRKNYENSCDNFNSTALSPNLSIDF